MKALHAGYVSSALWDAILRRELPTEINWQDVINQLSHFVIDEDFGRGGSIPPELEVLENILSRGLPTLPSLRNEKELEERTGLTIFDVGGKSEVAAYQAILNTQDHKDIPELIGRALCIVCPGAAIEPSEGFMFPEFGCGEESTAFDSKAEEDFWNGPLHHLLGPGGMQLALRQRPLETIIGGSPMDKRVDVAIQLPGSARTTLKRGLVIEVDGPTHQEHSTRIGDHARDEQCKSAGWATTYRHKLWNVQATDLVDRRHLGVSSLLSHPYFSFVVKNIAEPLTNHNLGRRALLVALLPLAVARLQRVFIELIRADILNLNDPVWKIAVFDRDGLTGCGNIAAEDFCDWLDNVWALYAPNRKVPRIEVMEIGPGQDQLLPKDTAVLLDLSVMMRYGVTTPTPSGIKQTSGYVPRVVIRSDYYRRDPYHQLSNGEVLTQSIEGPELEKRLTYFLQNIFRKVAFRPKQFEIVRRALLGEPVIALLPTGAGKSITYQLPALLQNGTSVVVAPLKSLMKDQVDNLEKIGITCCAFINSMTTSKERQRNTTLMQQGVFKFVYVSPERFIIREFRCVLDAMRREGKVFFNYGVVDEAHCVSEWGHDFRTAYLSLGKNMRKFCASRFNSLPILALTGTASYEVLDDVHKELGYNHDDDLAVRPDSMKRENLKYRVLQLNPKPVVPDHVKEWNASNTVGMAKLAEIPKRLAEATQLLATKEPTEYFNAGLGSGLVFCPHAGLGLNPSPHGVMAVKDSLLNIYPDLGVYLDVYFGSAEEKAGRIGFDPVAVQNSFSQGTKKLLVCTKAFGMGIDKADIRLTMHFNIPPSLESFYQEAGRAGRDGNDALCWILYAGTTYRGKTIDFGINHKFHARSFPGHKLEEAKVLEMLDENRMPDQAARGDITNMLFEETGIDYRINIWKSKNGNVHRIYINHPDYKDANVFVSIPANGKLTSGTKNPYPESDVVCNLVIEWLQTHKPEDTSWQTWLYKETEIIPSPGIEELLNDMATGEQKVICFKFENGYIDEIAKELAVDQGDVRKLFNFADNVESFIDKVVRPATPDATKDWIRAVYPRIRLREHTLRSVYRLTILGLVDEYEVDYANGTITITIRKLPQNGYLNHLRAYLDRHAPMQTTEYLKTANESDHGTELRGCVNAIIQFVYDRIAKQRIEALAIMEQTAIRGIDDAGTFENAVTDFFDSKYLPLLRPHIDHYNDELVFKLIKETAGAQSAISHLLGACNRLLPENPDNAAFHALRAFAIALLGYRDQDIKSEIDAALDGFEKFSGWDRKAKMTFLLALRAEVVSLSSERLKAFDSTIIADHVRWLTSYMATVLNQPSDIKFHPGREDETGEIHVK